DPVAPLHAISQRLCAGRAGAKRKRHGRSERHLHNESNPGTRNHHFFSVSAVICFCSASNAAFHFVLLISGKSVIIESTFCCACLSCSAFSSGVATAPARKNRD